jgi:hypothetical protein
MKTADFCVPHEPSAERVAILTKIATPNPRARQTSMPVELCGPDDPQRFWCGMAWGIVISIPLWLLIIWACSALGPVIANALQLLIGPGSI